MLRGAKTTLSLVAAGGAALAALFLAIGLSCGFDLSSGQARCGPEAECPSDFECRYNGLCYRKGVGLSTTCDNGDVEAAETCDPPSTCPSSCEDGNACTLDIKVGSARTCNVGCLRTIINTCSDDDGCCPEGCTFDDDTDCSATCDNGEIDDKETCDPPSSCPQVADCNDGNECTTDFLTGSASNCNAACGNTAVTECGLNDGCCPAGCNAGNDTDCSASCGNGIVDVGEGETCDEPEHTCPTLADCDDELDCTFDTLTGSAANCNARCNHTQITQRIDGDGCCPPGFPQDTDCANNCNEDLFCDYPDETPTTCPLDCWGCMDGYCDQAGGENSSNCYQDCYDPCGDGICDTQTETSSSCPVDCYCGNGTCEPWENSGSCSIDCGGGCDGGPCFGDGGTGAR